MASTESQGTLVIRYYQETDAPTGESMKIQTVDGIWRHLGPFPPPRQTGERRGILRDNRIYEVP